MKMKNVPFSQAFSSDKSILIWFNTRDLPMEFLPDLLHLSIISALTNQEQFWQQEQGMLVEFQFGNNLVSW